MPFQSLTQKMRMKDLSNFGRIITLFSFVLGTMLLLFYLYFDKSYTIMNIGFYFVIVAFLLNSLLFVINIVAIIINNKYRLEFLKTCGVMLINIPIAILYFYIVVSIEFSTNL